MCGRDFEHFLHQCILFLKRHFTIDFSDEHKVRSIGVSNYEVKHIKEIQSFGKMMPSVNQVEFHPHFTRNELREYCKSEGIFFQVFLSINDKRFEC